MGVGISYERGAPETRTPTSGSRCMCRECGDRGRPGSPGCRKESEARMVKVNFLTLSARPAGLSKVLYPWPDPPTPLLLTPTPTSGSRCMCRECGSNKASFWTRMRTSTARDPHSPCSSRSPPLSLYLSRCLSRTHTHAYTNPHTHADTHTKPVWGGVTGALQQHPTAGNTVGS